MLKENGTNHKLCQDRTAHPSKCRLRSLLLGMTSHPIKKVKNGIHLYRARGRIQDEHCKHLKCRSPVCLFDFLQCPSLHPPHLPPRSLMKIRLCPTPSASPRRRSLFPAAVTQQKRNIGEKGHRGELRQQNTFSRSDLKRHDLYLLFVSLRVQVLQKVLRCLELFLADDAE